MRDDPVVTNLVARARNGDRQAWDALVERYAPLTWSICRRHLRAQPGEQWSAGGGTSRVGLRSKKPVGLSTKPQRATGMTGQSSGRGTWVGPNVCQSTMSVPSMSWSPAMKAGRPAPPGFWLTKSPAGQRWAGSYLVTHRWLAANPARAASGESGSASSTGADSG